MKTNLTVSSLLALVLAVLFMSSPRLAADPASASTSGWNESKWLSDLSLTMKESYDNNVLAVSGLGLPEQASWVNTASLKVGFNLLPFLPSQHTIQTLTLAYQPDVVTFANASAESYTAHKINTAIKGKSGAFTFSLDNAYLLNFGSNVAATYALNQLAGTAGNQNDKYRNFFAQAPVRERRGQVQDRYTLQLQYNVGNIFIRAVSSLLYYNLHTAQYNTSVAPYKGYQDWVDRSDVNGGVDLGYKLAPDLAVSLGYRGGYQFQQQFALALSSDQHFSSSHYQRLLVGLDGKLASWLTVKLAAGPDFRDYNAATPINNLKPEVFYGEAAVVAALSARQTLTLNYKRWVFVSSTGLAPYEDTAYALVYRWNATERWGFELGGKQLQANYSMGNDLTGSAPSLRNDFDYVYSAGISYAFSPKFVVSATLNHESGRNGVKGLPATYQPTFRDFDHQITGLAAQYKF